MRRFQAVLLSARLGAKSVRHLLKETGARSILLSKRTERLIAQDVKDLAEVKMVAPFTTFLHGQVLSDSVNGAGQGGRLAVDESDTNILILHSSGTTGLPKPIRLAHRYVLGYAACHRFPDNQPLDWMNLSTLPLYHGFGLLAPCLSLSVGLCCVFPPSSVIPAAHSTMDLFTAFGVRSLMTVPSILEDMVGLGPAERSRALRLLQSMHFIATGGGPLNPDVGAALASEGIKLLNHYGATEIGAIAPIFKPSVDYDYRFLRLRTDLGLQLHPVADGGPEEPQRFKLVGHPFGWERPFEIQDELVKRPDSDHVEVKILGRRDDLIVLKNGEKVLPRTLEQALAQDAAIKTAVCIGQGQFEIVVLVEPASAASEDADAFVEHVWQLVSQLNPSLDQHAQVSSKRAIISKPPDKSIPRSDKGSVMRKEVQAVFEDEIRAAYEALELETVSTGVVFDVEHLEDSMRGLVTTVLGEKLTSHDDWREEDDLFELGMDSLQATRLARILNASMGKHTDERFTASFIYKHPSAAKLTTAVGATVRGEVHLSEQAEDRGPEMRAIADEYLQALDAEETKTNAADNGAVVLLTGSTGNLGAHVLGCLAQNDRVARVICVNRRRVGADDDLRARQDQVNSSAGVALSSRGWEKIVFLAANMQATDLGLAQEQLLELRGTVTHIVHLAWPMDFNRQLSSFRPQLNALKALIELARSAYKVRPHVKPRILFASSISVVRHYSEQAGSIIVPERSLDDPLVTTPMGYAEAKWVCERMLQRVGEKWAHECTPVTVRIGQLSGPERTDGIWKTEEHMPALIKASQLVSAFPSLQGVSVAVADYSLNDRLLDYRISHGCRSTVQPKRCLTFSSIQKVKLSQCIIWRIPSGSLSQH